jgi:hypothetical protein
MKSKKYVLASFILLFLSNSVLAQCFCPTCKTKRYSRQSSLESLVIINDKIYRTSAPENILEIMPLFKQLADNIPRRAKRYYKRIEDFKLDTEELIKLFKEKKENTKGLELFFKNYLERIKKGKDTYIPMLLIRGKGDKNQKVWIIHMEWNEEKNIKKANLKSTWGVSFQLLSFAVDYNTGKILYEEH